jgi:hypothetical protein
VLNGQRELSLFLRVNRKAVGEEKLHNIGKAMVMFAIDATQHYDKHRYAEKVKSLQTGEKG